MPVHISVSRSARLFGAALVISALWPVSAASAHAVFIATPTTFPVNTQQALVMNVPHEFDDTDYNIDVLVAVPAGWSALSCQAQATWSCSIGTVSGRQSIHFVKATGAAPLQDETFHFTVRTASVAGSFAFPTVQSYVAGEVVRWIGASSSDNPAPILKTTGGTTTTTRPTPTTRPRATTTTRHAPPPTVIVGGTTSTTTPATTVPGATTTTTPGETTTTVLGGSTTTSAAGANASTTTGATSTTSTDGTPTGATSTTASGVAAAEGNDDGGTSVVPFVVIALLAALAGGGFFAVRKLRAQP